MAPSIWPAEVRPGPCPISPVSTAMPMVYRGLRCATGKAGGDVDRALSTAKPQPKAMASQPASRALELFKGDSGTDAPTAEQYEDGVYPMVSFTEKNVGRWTPTTPLSFVQGRAKPPGFAVRRSEDPSGMGLGGHTLRLASYRLPSASVRQCRPPNGSFSPHAVTSIRQEVCDLRLSQVRKLTETPVVTQGTCREARLRNVRRQDHARRHGRSPVPRHQLVRGNRLSSHTRLHGAGDGHPRPPGSAAGRGWERRRIPRRPRSPQGRDAQPRARTSSSTRSKSAAPVMVRRREGGRSMSVTWPCATGSLRRERLAQGGAVQRVHRPDHPAPGGLSSGPEDVVDDEHTPAGAAPRG